MASPGRRMPGKASVISFGRLEMKIRNIVKSVSLVLTTSIVLGIAGTTRYVSAAGISLSGSSTVQKYGVIEGNWDDSSAMLTLKGRANTDDPYKPIESINVKLNNSTGIEGSLKYSVYVESKGWQEYKTEGNDAGMINKALRIEALKMELTGDLASKYTVEYAVQIEKDGSAQNFVSDGAVAGSVGGPKKIEEIKIRIVPAGQGTTTNVNYRVHRDSSGWDTKWSSNGDVSGAAGKAKQIDSIELNLTGNQYKGGITYRAKTQKTVWEKKWSSNGATSGTSGKRIDAVAIKLTGEVADHYDVYYRVCVQSVGWLGWSKNGESNGTSNLTYKLEALQVVLVAKGGAAPGDLGGINSIDDITDINPKTPLLPGSGLFRMGDNATVSYAVRTADGWSSIVSDGTVLDVSKQITGIAVGVNIPKVSLEMSVDLPDFGEPEYDENDSYDVPYSLRIITANKRIESIGMQIGTWISYGDENEEAYGEFDNCGYTIFYRVKTSGSGWMAWTSYSDYSDEEDYPYYCGTDEVGQSISAIQIIVLPNGQKPANDLGEVTSANSRSLLTMNDFPAPYLVTTNNKFAKWCLKTFPKKYSDPYNGVFRQSKSWKYVYGGSSKKGCDCSGFVVYVMRKYFHKRVYHGMYKLSHKIGKNISYSNMKPGDWLCDWSYHHGWVSFYVGKDNYGHEVVLTGYTDGTKTVTPTLEYWDIKAWLSEPKHSLRRK